MTRMGSFPANRFFGKYRATVVDNEDPQQLGRLTARVPEVLGDVNSGWALPCVPYAGDGEGFYTVPPVGAGVWIEFEAGDPSRPIWNGCWWGDGQLPADNGGQSAQPPLKIWRSEQGLMVALDDDSQTISVSDENGDNLLEILVSSGQVTIKGGSKVVVEAPAIELVEGASHAIVFGDELNNYLNQLVTNFNTHQHVGQQAGPYPVTPAPPVQPWSPPTPSLLSTKVKAG